MRIVDFFAAPVVSSIEIRNLIRHNALLCRQCFFIFLQTKGKGSPWRHMMVLMGHDYCRKLPSSHSPSSSCIPQKDTCGCWKSLVWRLDCFYRLFVLTLFLSTVCLTLAKSSPNFEHSSYTNQNLSRCLNLVLSFGKVGSKSAVHRNPISSDEG